MKFSYEETFNIVKEEVERIALENYEIKILIVEDLSKRKKKYLGYVKPNFLTYNLNYLFIVKKQFITRTDINFMFQVALHELAHIIDFKQNSNLKHNKSFRDICKQLGCDNNNSYCDYNNYKDSIVYEEVLK